MKSEAEAGEKYFFSLKRMRQVWSSWGKGRTQPREEQGRIGGQRLGGKSYARTPGPLTDIISASLLNSAHD